MAEKFVLVPQREMRRTYSQGPNNNTIKAPPPGIPPTDELLKTMQIEEQGPARLNSDNLAYVNTERGRGENNTTELEEEEEEEGSWSSLWQRV